MSLSCEIKGAPYTRTLVGKPDDLTCGVCLKEIELPAYYCNSKKKAWHKACFNDGVQHYHWQGVYEHVDLNIDVITVIKEDNDEAD